MRLEMHRQALEVLGMEGGEGKEREMPWGQAGTTGSRGWSNRSTRHVPYMEKLRDTGTTSQELEEASLTEAFQTSPGRAPASGAVGTPLRRLGNYLGARQSVSPSTIRGAGETRNEQRLQKPPCSHPACTRSHAVTT